MDDPTREQAQKKKDNMLESIGYPDQILNRELIEELYSPLELKDGDYYGNARRLDKFWMDWEFGRLRSPFTRDDWLENQGFTFVIMVNAFYSPTSNAFVFPAGFLRYAMIMTKFLLQLGTCGRNCRILNSLLSLPRVGQRPKEPSLGSNKSNICQQRSRGGVLIHANICFLSFFCEQRPDVRPGGAQLHELRRRGLHHRARGEAESRKSMQPCEEREGRYKIRCNTSLAFSFFAQISHGFDDQGSQRDHVGNLKNWWSDETLRRYKEKAQCVVDQYSDFVAEQVDMNLNGRAGQGENIADNAGTLLAYRAYGEIALAFVLIPAANVNGGEHFVSLVYDAFRVYHAELWMQRNGVEDGLPGLPFSNRQMYWIAHARSFCATFNDDFLAKQITTGTHSPSEFRVNGPYMNYEAFARDFNCPPDSYMNPTRKCTIW